MNPVIADNNHLAEIAKPIAQEMKMFKPSLIKELRSYVPIKISLTLTVIVFILNVFLHVLCLWLYHRFRIIRKFVPSFLMSKDEKMEFKPVLGVNSDDQSVIQNLSSKMKDRYHIMLQSELNKMSIDTQSEIDIQKTQKTPLPKSISRIPSRPTMISASKSHPHLSSATSAVDL